MVNDHLVGSFRPTGALFALVNAVLISTVAIAIRRMSMTESAETLTLYQMSIMTLCTAGLLTLGFQAPHLGDALMLALGGVGNGIARTPAILKPLYEQLSRQAILIEPSDFKPICLADTGSIEPLGDMVDVFKRA